MHNYLWLCTIVSSKKKKKKNIYIYIYKTLSLIKKIFYLFFLFLSLRLLFFLPFSFSFFFTLPHCLDPSRPVLYLLLWVCLRFVLHLTQSSPPCMSSEFYVTKLSLCPWQAQLFSIELMPKYTQRNGFVFQVSNLNVPSVHLYIYIYMCVCV